LSIYPFVLILQSTTVSCWRYDSLNLITTLHTFINTGTFWNLLVEISWSKSPGHITCFRGSGRFVTLVDGQINGWMKKRLID